MHGGPDDDTYALYIKPDDKSIGYKTSGTTNDWISIANVNALWDGNWHLLAATYDGTEKVIYLDSIAILNVAATGAIDSAMGYNLLIGAVGMKPLPGFIMKGLSMKSGFLIMHWIALILLNYIIWWISILRVRSLNHLLQIIF